jgi:hypothetical protein
MKDYFYGRNLFYARSFRVILSRSFDKLYIILMNKYMFKKITISFVFVSLTEFVYSAGPSFMGAGLP